MKSMHGLLVVIIIFSMMLAPIAVSAQSAIPTDAAITSATLSVYVSQVNGFPVNVHRITNDWSETGVTWQNFNNAYDPTIIATFTPTSAGWQSVDVKAEVLAWLNNTNANYGFLLTQAVEAPSDTNVIGFRSSEVTTVERRPKLEICYQRNASENNCITIQRSGAEPVDVVDAYIYSRSPTSNIGTSPSVYTGYEAGIRKHALLRFYFSLLDDPTPDVSIVKYTNDAVASDPNGTDVPRIEPGQPVVWTYEITNTGLVPVAAEAVIVTDDQAGVTPVFYMELSGNGDTTFDPTEVWLYRAEGTAVNLSEPQSEVITFPGLCTNGGTETARTAYINQGTVDIPDATATAQSSYCNPITNQNGYKHYFSLLNGLERPAEPDIVPFKVTVGYEDLPLLTGQNDYDYNDWVVRIQGSVFVDQANRDLWKKMIINFEPGGRGATYTHSFHMGFPANTFSSNGTATLVTYGPNGNPLSTETIPFVASRLNEITIFPDTGTVFPQNYSNTKEDQPRVKAQRTAVLTIEFDQAIPFDLSKYNLTIPHGSGLFFDPFLRVKNTGDVVRRGDNRLLNVSELDREYLWPEERIRIDRAYPDLTFISGTPPKILFPDRWWVNNNTCVVDGVRCP